MIEFWSLETPYPGRSRKYANRIIVYSDSQLVVNQATRRWRVRKPHLEPLFRLELLPNGKHVEVVWVGRDSNEEAHDTANLFLEEAIVKGLAAQPPSQAEARTAHAHTAGKLIGSRRGTKSHQYTRGFIGRY